MADTDTIYAPATAPGKAGVAVIRISGERALETLTTLTGKKDFNARQATLCKLRDSQGQIIDEALTLYFNAPHSFTGEEVVELHIHGSRAVQKMLANTLEKQGLRLAEPGEFSKRAFYNDKMDLTQLEGLADLIEAETEVQHSLAMQQKEGVLEGLYSKWRDALIAILAELEAYIDFPDEELPESLDQKFTRSITELKTHLEAHASDARGERLREGLYIPILGAPNAGKSSLLNWISKRDVAIVSETAGTTRDTIEVAMNIKGYPVVLCDTAGIRETTDAIEQEGIKRALAAAEKSDLALCLFDSSSQNLDEGTQKLLTSFPHALAIFTKSDVANAAFSIEGISFSAKTGQGGEQLLEALEQLIETHYPLTQEPLYTRERHKALLAETTSHLETYLANRAAKKPIELCAEDVRLAAKALGSITGKIDIEEILDAIFSKFCIGK